MPISWNTWRSKNAVSILAICVLALGLSFATPPDSETYGLGVASAAAQSQVQTDWDVNDDPAWGPDASQPGYAKRGWRGGTANRAHGYGISRYYANSNYIYASATNGWNPSGSWAQWSMGERVGTQEIRVYIPSNHSTARVKYRLFLNNTLLRYSDWVHQANEEGWYSLGNMDSNGGDVIVELHYDDSATASGRTGAAYRSVGVDALAMICVSNCSTQQEATIPDTPRNLYAVAGDVGELIVEWDSPSDNGGSPILGYQLTYLVNGSDENNAKTIQLRSNVTTYTLSNLADNTTYLIGLSAYNRIGHGLNAATTAITNSGITVPSKPRYLTASADDEYSLTVKWTIPENVGGAPVSRYRVSYGNNNTPFRDVHVDSGTGSDDIHFNYTIRGLVSDTTYMIRIRAINSAGEGRAATIEATTRGRNVEPPGSPQNLSTTKLSDNKFRIDWSPPADDGGANVAHYIVNFSRPRISSQIGPWASPDWRISGTSITFTGRLGATYTVTVAARNSVGTGQPDVTYFETSQEPAPGPVQNLHLTEPSSGNRRFVISWSPPSTGNVSYYTVKVSRPGRTFGLIYPTGTQHIITDHHYNTTYTATVTAYSPNGLAGTPATARITTRPRSKPPVPEPEKVVPPSRVTGLRATSPGEGILRITWSPPTSSGSAAISHYYVRVSDDSTRYKTTGNSFTHYGLLPGKEYQINVTAVNRHDSSSRTDTIYAVTSPRVRIALEIGRSIKRWLWLDSPDATITWSKVQGIQPKGGYHLDWRYIDAQGNVIDPSRIKGDSQPLDPYSIGRAYASEVSFFIFQGDDSYYSQWRDGKWERKDWNPYESEFSYDIESYTDKYILQVRVRAFGLNSERTGSYYTDWSNWISHPHSRLTVKCKAYEIYNDLKKIKDAIDATNLVLTIGGVATAIFTGGSSVLATQGLKQALIFAAKQIVKQLLFKYSVKRFLISTIKDIAKGSIAKAAELALIFGCITFALDEGDWTEENSRQLGEEMIREIISTENLQLDVDDVLQEWAKAAI